ncbi:Uncharacterised protein [Actinobacillus pleuropneumoniae]|nr:Uncharacterised protein [Actinobacillus pleuropneumoniae]
MGIQADFRISVINGRDKVYAELTSYLFGTVVQQSRERDDIHGIAMHVGILQLLNRAHGLRIVLQANDVEVHGMDQVQNLLFRQFLLGNIGGEKLGVSLQHRQRRPQIMGKNGIELLALLHRTPERL